VIGCERQYRTTWQERVGITLALTVGLPFIVLWAIAWSPFMIYGLVGWMLEKRGKGNE